MGKRKQAIILIVLIQNSGEPQLLQVAQASRAACHGSSRLKNWKEDSGQHRDDRNRNEQFDQRKPTTRRSGTAVIAIHQ
jgi:hypothetical protein